jgi:hypothetical protein
VILLESPKGWKDYELLDSGDFEKLERFGGYTAGTQGVMEKKHA